MPGTADAASEGKRSREYRGYALSTAADSCAAISSGYRKAGWSKLSMRAAIVAPNAFHSIERTRTINERCLLPRRRCASPPTQSATEVQGEVVCAPAVVFVVRPAFATSMCRAARFEHELSASFGGLFPEFVRITALFSKARLPEKACQKPQKFLENPAEGLVLAYTGRREISVSRLLGPGSCVRARKLNRVVSSHLRSVRSPRQFCALWRRHARVPTKSASLPASFGGS